MAKLTKDLPLNCFDPRTRVRQAAPASADVYPVGTIVMKDITSGHLAHVSQSASAGSTVVGMVVEHQEVLTAGDHLEFQQGLFSVLVSGSAQPNDVAFFADSVTAHVASGSAGLLPGGRFRMPVLDGQAGHWMIELGKLPAGTAD